MSKSVNQSTLWAGKRDFRSIHWRIKPRKHQFSILFFLAPSPSHIYIYIVLSLCLSHNSQPVSSYVSVIPWFKFGTDIHLDWRMNWLDFGLVSKLNQLRLECISSIITFLFLHYRNINTPKYFIYLTWTPPWPQNTSSNELLHWDKQVCNHTKQINWDLMVVCLYIHFNPVIQNMNHLCVILW